MKKIATILVLMLLTSCKSSLPVLEMKVSMRGSTVPRNSREQLIFDYYQALKEQRYEEAYKLRGREASAEKLRLFIQNHTQDYPSLATKISIGEETQRGSDDDPCDYGYVVYVSRPNYGVLGSGQVSLYAKPDDPETCFIYYNSAFGSAP